MMFISSDITEYKTSTMMSYTLAVNRNGVFEPILQGTRQPEPAKLSDRELDVLKLTAEGFTEKEIAHQLFISSETVKVHRRNMLTKTSKKNAVELVRYALANSWL
jgi:DNA-binding NarL/FixJ family response regulator